MLTRAAGLLLGYAADRTLGDPQRGHPVAVFGRVAAGLEQRLYADRRTAGVAHAAILVGGVTLAGAGLERATRGRPVLRAGVVAVTTWAVLGGRSLDREAAAVQELLPDDAADAEPCDGDLDPARRRLTHLVGRDTRRLDADQIARAVVESVAENTSDAVVAPLVWGALAGVPGLLGYRAANTLDAMVGHRGARYGRFGWASARLDDVLNLPGARVGGLLTAGLAPTVGGSTGQAWRAWRHDASGHPSPNAGVVEASFAGALGVRLGGENHYAHGVEHRVVMGDGPLPGPADIARVRRLARRVSHGAAAAAVLAAAVIEHRGP